MKILYASGLSPNDSSLYRLWALERLGHEVIPLNAYAYEPSQPLVRKLVHRVQIGPWVQRLNQDVLAFAEEERPEVFWADKLLFLQPETLQRLRAKGVRTVSYMIDNAFGPRRDPGWRLYRRCLPHFDLHAVQRDSNLLQYRAAGARDVVKIQTAFEATVHFPPPPGWSDRDRNRGVSFIGTPYDQRARFLTQLAKAYDLPVVVSGDRVWKKALAAVGGLALYGGDGGLYHRHYREAIWRSKVNLSFLTHSNEDEFAHKSFEIAGCGGFLLAERSPGHVARFVEDQEAVFFADLDECAAKVSHYLPNEAARQRIAAAGHARAVRDGYDNDAQVAKILTHLEEHAPSNVQN